MRQHIPYAKLTLQDRHAEQEYVRMQGQASLKQPQRSPYAAYPRQMQRSAYPVVMHTKSPDFPAQRITKRRKRPLFLLLAFLLPVMVIVTSGAYYVLTDSKANVQTSIFPVNIPSQGGEPSSSPSALKDMALTRIKQLAADVERIKRSGADVSAYQQKLVRDQATFSAATSPKEYVSLLIQVASDITSLQGDLAGGDVNTLLSNFQQEAQQWGDAHKYHDTYDGKDYYLNSSYLNMDGHNGVSYGEGAYMQEELAAGNPQAAQDIKDDYFQLAMLEANYEDATPYNQPHQVDQSLLNYFHVQHTRVLIVSLTEQALRIYNNGTLELAFQVTTGRAYRPTPAGHFQLTQHFYNYTMTSYDVPGSPDYYAPVVVQNAIQFMQNGYLIHSSQWRKDYGPLTQFPHRDAGGDPQASTGSHGCINVAPDILSKLDATITDQTPLIIF